MILVCHQAEHLSYLGIIYKILQSDVFVILDTSGFRKNYFDARNIIRTKEDKQWVTIPVHASMNQPLNTVRIDYSHKWQSSYLQSIKQNYSKAKYFNEIYPEIERIILKQASSLAELNIELLMFILSKFNYKGKVLLGSNLNLNQHLSATDMLIDICKKIGADTYLSGIGGRDYLEEEKFKENNLELRYQNFVHPVYEQVYKQKFIQNLSSIDFLMNNKLDKLTMNVV